MIGRQFVRDGEHFSPTVRTPMYCISWLIIVGLTLLGYTLAVFNLTGVERTSSSRSASSGHDDVDMVYLWVNGSDPAWQRRYAQVFKTSNFSSERFMPSNEIYFSIASVGRFAPWVRRIHVVTQAQKFDLSPFSRALREKIVFVDHKDIMPKSALPAFSSLALDACLQNIPGLAENFIYSNDDFVMYSPFPKHEAFANGTFKVLSRVGGGDFYDPLQPNSYVYPNANAAFLIEQKFGARVHNSWHGAYFMTKTACRETWRLFPEEINRTVHNRLRRYAPLYEGGDVSFIALARAVATFRGLQVLDMQYTFKMIDGYNEVLVTQANNHTALYIVLQYGLGRTEEQISKMCRRLLDETKEGFDASYHQKFCDTLPAKPSAVL